MVYLVFILIAVVAVLSFVMVNHRKGDFSFRIRKLLKRTSDLLAQLMQLREESEYLLLYRGDLDKGDLERLATGIDECNEKIVEVNDGLKVLEARARSLFDFADLYVDIGIEEEKLELAESSFSKLSALFRRLEDRVGPL